MPPWLPLSCAGLGWACSAAPSTGESTSPLGFSRMSSSLIVAWIGKRDIWKVQTFRLGSGRISSLDNLDNPGTIMTHVRENPLSCCWIGLFISLILFYCLNLLKQLMRDCNSISCTWVSIAWKTAAVVIVCSDSLNGWIVEIKQPWIQGIPVLELTNKNPIKVHIFRSRSIQSWQNLEWIIYQILPA